MLHALPQTLLPSLGISLNMDIARQEAQRPVGARLQHFLPNWQAMTDDPWILKTIRGYSLELTSTPRQHHPTPPIALNQEKSAALTAEIDKLLQKEAIRPVKASPGEFLSPIFLVPKADGSWRPVINLRDLNSHITQHHFKMEGIRTVKGLMRKGDWLTKLDLKDAYLSVPMNQAHTHLLRFQWQSQTYQFDTLPFGLSSAPYVFTKLLKPVVAILRRLGIRVVLYLDDMLIMASSKEEARAHLATAMHLLTALGFILNLDKSVLTPTQRVIFLGFCLDSRTMLISLPTPRIQSIQRLIRETLAQGQATILKLSQLLGSMVSTHPAVLAAPLHYRHLERAKITALKHSHNYNTVVTTSDNMRQDLTWWFQELPRHNGRSMQIVQWDMVIESDASTLGWGASLNNTSTGGPWAPQERSHHINYLELLAAFLALKTFATNTYNKAILLRLDNVTAIAFLNRMGGTHSETLCSLAVHIWEWCLERNIFIHAEHLPWKLNVRADWHSRHTQDCSDWQLHPLIFQQLQDKLGPFSIDLFASRTNTQLSTYCSWKPDPSAIAIDALSISWRDHHPYLFPPFSLLIRCLEKINREKVEAVVIAPVWCNQVWYPLLLQSLQDAPILLPNTMDIILNPRGEPHPLVQEGHLPLAAWPVSGKVMAQKAFQTEWCQSCRCHGERQRSQPIPVSGEGGVAGVLNDRLIQFQPL